MVRLGGTPGAQTPAPVHPFPPLKAPINRDFVNGMWGRRWLEVAGLYSGGLGVVGSNPATPTIKEARFSGPFLFL